MSISESMAVSLSFEQTKSRHFLRSFIFAYGFSSAEKMAGLARFSTRMALDFAAFNRPDAILAARQ